MGIGLTVKREVLLVEHGQVGVQALQLPLVHLAGVGDRQRHLEIPASNFNCNKNCPSLI